MSSWSNVSIHTKKHTVSIPKQQFIRYSQILGEFYRIYRSVWDDLISIYCYQDGVVRFTFSNSECLRSTIDYPSLPGFEDALDKDIKFILDL